MPSAHIWGVVFSAQPFEMQNVEGHMPRVTEPRRTEKPLVARVEVLVTPPQEHVTDVQIPEILRGEMLQEQRQAAR